MNRTRNAISLCHLDCRCWYVIYLVWTGDSLALPVHNPCDECWRYVFANIFELYWCSLSHCLMPAFCANKSQSVALNACVCECVRRWACMCASCRLPFPNGLEGKSMLCFPQIHANISRIHKWNCYKRQHGLLKERRQHMETQTQQCPPAVDIRRNQRKNADWCITHITCTTMMMMMTTMALSVRLVHALVSLMPATTQFHFMYSCMCSQA